MCRVFISADPQSYESRTRSVRLHGVVTSIRLENLHWEVLEEIAARDGMAVTQLITRLYDELVEARGAVGVHELARRPLADLFVEGRAGGLDHEEAVEERVINRALVIVGLRHARGRFASARADFPCSALSMKGGRPAPIGCRPRRPQTGS